MTSTDADARTALRVLYGAAAAHLREVDADADVDVAALLSDGLVQVGATDLLAAGVMSVAEQLRDVAAWRRMEGATLVRVLRTAHTDVIAHPVLVGPAGDRAPQTTRASHDRPSGSRDIADVTALVLDAAVDYLTGGPDQLARGRLAELLLPTPHPALLALVQVLAASLRWRAVDQQVPAHELVRRICLGLARRDAA